jgi:hypothetical protein
MNLTTILLALAYLAGYLASGLIAIRGIQHERDLPTGLGLLGLLGFGLLLGGVLGG